MIIAPEGKQLLIRIKGKNNASISTITIFEQRKKRVERGYAVCQKSGFGTSFWRGGTFKGFDCQLSACAFEKGNIDDALCTKPIFRKEFTGKGKVIMQKEQSLPPFDKAQLFAL